MMEQARIHERRKDALAQSLNAIEAAFSYADAGERDKAEKAMTLVEDCFFDPAPC